MKTASSAILFAFAATTFARQQTLQLAASSPSSNSANPLQFVDASAGKRVLTPSSSGNSAPITLSNGLLSSMSSDGTWTANLDGGLVTFSESTTTATMPGNVTVNSQGVVAQDGHVQDWYLCNMGETKALAYGQTSDLDCEEVTLLAAEPERVFSETITIKTMPTNALVIYGNEYPAPQSMNMTVFWQGLAKAMFSLFGTMGLGGLVAYRGLQEKNFKKNKSVSFAQ